MKKNTFIFLMIGIIFSFASCKTTKKSGGYTPGTGKATVGELKGQPIPVTTASIRNYSDAELKTFQYFNGDQIILTQDFSVHTKEIEEGVRYTIDSTKLNIHEIKKLTPGALLTSERNGAGDVTNLLVSFSKQYSFDKIWFYKNNLGYYYSEVGSFDKKRSDKNRYILRDGSMYQITFPAGLSQLYFLPYPESKKSGTEIQRTVAEGDVIEKNE